MEMDVVNRLTGEVADVCDHTVAVCKALLLGKLRNHRVNMTDQRLIFFRYLGSGCKMLLRNHEKMRRRQGRDIQISTPSPTSRPHRPSSSESHRQ